MRACLSEWVRESGGLFSKRRAEDVGEGAASRTVTGRVALYAGSCMEVVSDTTGFTTLSVVCMNENGVSGVCPLDNVQC